MSYNVNVSWKLRFENSLNRKQADTIRKLLWRNIDNHIIVNECIEMLSNTDYKCEFYGSWKELLDRWGIILKFVTKDINGIEFDMLEYDNDREYTPYGLYDHVNFIVKNMELLFWESIPKLISWDYFEANWVDSDEKVRIKIWDDGYAKEYKLVFSEPKEV